MDWNLVIDLVVVGLGIVLVVFLVRSAVRRERLKGDLDPDAVTEVRARQESSRAIRDQTRATWEKPGI